MTPLRLKGLILGIGLASTMMLAGAQAAETTPSAKAPPGNKQTIISQTILRNLSTTADHSKFKELQGPFESGPQVTKACLSCHNKAAEQLRHNVHWTWLYTNPQTGQKLGKERVINAFCTNALGNEGMCAMCHAGFNRAGPEYDLDKVENMDCLVCHDQTGKYFKTVVTPGHPKVRKKFAPKKPVPFTEAAQHVGLPTRKNCGKCHFYGGGGDNVKHGDLSSVLFDPPRDVDVHMSSREKGGAGLVCTDCHVGAGHVWSGSRYVMNVGDDGKRPPGAPRQKTSCAQCHGTAPHDWSSPVGWKLNNHTDRVACETCHIPAFARGGVATKVFWDWSTAGRLKDGKPYAEEGYTQGDGKKRHTYVSMKGTFKWAENVVPTYMWANGTVRWTLPEDRIDPSKPVWINRVEGSADDPKARIMPFKVMKTVQPYDAERNVLAHINLWGEDDAAFWGNLDFAKAIAKGMEIAKRPYSGKFGFVNTRMLWPINHMVAPKEKALACNECHVRENGRLAALAGFYMPGRDRWSWLDGLGLLLAGLTLLASIGHALLRIMRANTGKRGA
ncbi:tetrathionate reductase family octaheme c-type cytochrome [Thermopetrobacter sp. TC1]|uniref:tetrathionate reductase family octaheme c-type cytochrome n=1 Tax=Thermopetrobacter sp. TC1 TaxID=1495045 RepID=UPI00056E5B54|nr:tetrathionate reductase family octaheme c-type cytochrome [Thermopetrobacter sp. TC1]